MKVLQVTAVDFTLKKFLIPLIDEMEKQGYIVHTACKAGKIAEELKKEGYVIHNVPFERNLNIISHISNIFKLVTVVEQF